jgi:hypothetical protein
MQTSSRMDRTQVRVFKKGQEPDDLLYWLSVPPIERIRTLETIRLEYNTWKYGPERRFQIGLLNANGVRYLVVGGYAVAFHGHPRYTKDLDFWIWPDPENAEKAVNTLRDFGFSSLGITAPDFLDTDNVIQLGQPPNRIDLITSVSGLDFETAFQHRIESRFEGLPIRVLYRWKTC